MKLGNCLKCDFLNKIDKTYPHNLGIELKCKKTLEPRLIDYIKEDELFKRAHSDIPITPPEWCPRKGKK